MFSGSFKPPRDAVWTWRAIHLFTTVVKPIFCKLDVEGREHIPAAGGCVMTCNHTMGPDFLLPLELRSTAPNVGTEDA